MHTREKDETEMVRDEVETKEMERDETEVEGDELTRCSLRCDSHQVRIRWILLLLVLQHSSSSGLRLHITVRLECGEGGK